MQLHHQRILKKFWDITAFAKHTAITTFPVKGENCIRHPITKNFDKRYFKLALKYVQGYLIKMLEKADTPPFCPSSARNINCETWETSEGSHLILFQDAIIFQMSILFMCHWDKAKRGNTVLTCPPAVQFCSSIHEYDKQLTSIPGSGQ